LMFINVLFLRHRTVRARAGNPANNHTMTQAWARLVSYDSKYGGYEITGETVTVGRGAKCDVRLADELGISAKHCVITRTVDAKTGTYTGTKLTSNCLLLSTNRRRRRLYLCLRICSRQ
jgi:hypothetical protein